MTQGANGNFSVSFIEICAGNLRERLREKEIIDQYTINFLF